MLLLHKVKKSRTNSFTLKNNKESEKERENERKEEDAFNEYYEDEDDEDFSVMLVG